MFRVVDVSACGDRNFCGYTFPEFAFLAKPPLRAEIIAIGLADEMHPPAGLVLGVVNGDHARILSIALAPQQRGKGHSRLLLEAFAAAAAGRGARRLVAEVPLGSTPLLLAPALERAGWTPVGARSLVIDARPATILRFLSDQVAIRPTSIELRPWRPEDADPLWAHDALRPSRYVPSAPDGAPFARTASFAIHHRGEVAGWIIGHDMGGNWLRVTSHEMNCRKGAARITFDVWHRYYTSISYQAWDRITFATSDKYPTFCRFLERRALNVVERWSWTVDYGRMLDGIH